MMRHDRPACSLPPYRPANRYRPETDSGAAARARELTSLRLPLYRRSRARTMPVRSVTSVTFSTLAAAR